MAETQQSFEKHAKLVPAYHFVLFFLIVVTLVGAMVNFFLSLDDHSRLYNAALILVISIIFVILFGLVRIFPLKAQDRAIRAEENLRHFALTGQLLIRGSPCRKSSAPLRARRRIPLPRPQSRRPESSAQGNQTLSEKLGKPITTAFNPLP